jgi:nicotinamidase-related amidase
MKKYQKSLIDPSEFALCLIDHQPQMFFGVGSTHRECVMNSVVGLAKAAKIFKVPTILTTVSKDTFSGAIYSKIQEVFPDITPIDRETLDAFEDENFKLAVKNTKRKKLLLAGLWTEVCVALPALAGLEEGYQTFAVVDACAGMSKTTHKTALSRMSQGGVRLVTWLAVMLEMQRDWSNKDTYSEVMKVVQEHGGAYGIGVEYRNFMQSQN